MEHLIQNRVKLKFIPQNIWISLEQKDSYAPVGKPTGWLKNKLANIDGLAEWAEKNTSSNDDFLSVSFSIEKPTENGNQFISQIEVSKRHPLAFLIWKQEFLRHYIDKEQFATPKVPITDGIEAFFKISDSEDTQVFERLEFYYKTKREELIFNLKSKNTRVASSTGEVEPGNRFLDPQNHLCYKNTGNENKFGYKRLPKNHHTTPQRFDYAQRYQELKDKITNLSEEFNSPYFDKMSPVFIEVTRNDQFKVTNSSQKMVFGYNKTQVNSIQGMRNFGPYKKVENADEIELIFIYQNKDDANNLYLYLKKGLRHYPGLQSYVGIPVSLADERIQYSTLEDLQDKLIRLCEDDLPEKEYNNKLAIVIGPFKKYEADEEEEYFYYGIKEKLLKKGISSQFISPKTIKDRNFHYSLPNISIAILAKLGGIPWKLDTPVNNELVLGFNVFKYQENQFIGNAVFFTNEGQLNSVKGLSSKDYEGIFENLRTSIKAYDEEFGLPERLVIHYYKTANHEEIRKLEKLLYEELELSIPYAVVEINDSRSKIDICFDVSYNFGMPKSGTYVKTGYNEYLLFNNSRYIDRPMRTIEELPVKVRISHISSEVFSSRELISQIYEFSRLNWKGLKQNSLPATITFSKWIAQFASHFGGQIPDTFNAQKRPWFL